MKNMQESDTILVQELSLSFQNQLSFYQELRDTVRSITSKLILSRGDMSGLLSGMEKKKKLLDAIQQERLRSSENVALWQERRNLYSVNAEIQALNDILAQTEKVIKEFLEGEDQLKKYLEKMYRKDS
ncbi:MAG: hypothetical protein ACLFQB_02195 [Chitinispirillaceae bacterium]